MLVCHRNSLCSESQAFGVTEVRQFNDSNIQSLWTIINFSFGAGKEKKIKFPGQSPKQLNCALQVVEIQLGC